MRRVWLVIIIVAAFTSCEKPISEFQSANFVKFFGSGSGANGFDVKELPAGYIAVGYDNIEGLNNQFFVIRTDRAGNTIWQKRFGNEFANEAYSVQVEGDDYFACGLSTDDNGIVSSHIVHLNSQGDSLGCLTVAGNNYSLRINDFVISESSIVVVGETNENSATQPDYFISKYSFEGDPRWLGVYGADGSSQSFKKVFVETDRILAVGTNNGKIGSSLTHISIATYNQLGAPLNSFNIEAEANQQFADAILLPSNEIVIAYNQLVQGKQEGRLMKISLASYTTLWNIQNGIGCEAKSLALSSDGIFTLSGVRDEAIHLFQIDGSGNIILTDSPQESKTLSGYVEKIIPTSDNGFLIVGTTAPDYGTMMQLIKTDSELFLFKP